MCQRGGAVVLYCGWLSNERKREWKKKAQDSLHVSMYTWRKPNKQVAVEVGLHGFLSPFMEIFITLKIYYSKLMPLLHFGLSVLTCILLSYD